MKIILLAGVAVCSAVAQSQTEPPPLLRLHRQLGTISARPYADTGIPVNVVGMTAMTGPPETWLIEMHDSFAGIENADKSHRPVAPFGAIVQADGPSADILAGSRSLIAVFRQAFSYRSEQAIQTLRKARYCQVSIYQVHPGSESDFAELVKSRRIAFDSVNLDRPVFNVLVPGLHQVLLLKCGDLGPDLGTRTEGGRPAWGFARFLAAVRGSLR
jgi:hypothetical protein